MTESRGKAENTQDDLEYLSAQKVKSAQMTKNNKQT